MTRPSASDGHGYLHTVWRLPLSKEVPLTLVAQFVGDADWYRHGDTAETAAERYLRASYRPTPMWTPGRYRVDVADARDQRPVVTIERMLPCDLSALHRTARNAAPPTGRCGCGDVHQPEA